MKYAKHSLVSSTTKLWRFAVFCFLYLCKMNILWFWTGGQTKLCVWHFLLFFICFIYYFVFLDDLFWGIFFTLNGQFNSEDADRECVKRGRVGYDMQHAPVRQMLLVKLITDRLIRLIYNKIIGLHLAVVVLFFSEFANYFPQIMAYYIKHCKMGIVPITVS